MKKLFIFLCVAFLLILGGCASDGSFDASRIPTIVIENPETGERRGCERIPSENILRCSVVIDGQNVITDFPLFDEKVQ